jgi:ferric-dicitrate binding protein FerR (iron transport regulator)
MNEPKDLVESLIRAAGRRAEPPDEAYRHVLAAATAALHKKTARRRERLWVVWAAAASVLALGVTLVIQWMPGAQCEELARIERAIGAVERATDDVWQPARESAAVLTKGVKVRTLAGAGAGLRLVGGASLRLAAGTEIMLDEPERLYLRAGTIYLDHRGSVGTGYRIETPAGVVRDLGTQFELRVEGGSLRLRIREGRVAVDRAGQTVEGSAGEQLELNELGDVVRSAIAATAVTWQWAETLASTPDVDGRPATELIAWVARETGRRLRYEAPAVEQRAATVILHGNIRHLPPLAALDAMIAATDLDYVLDGDAILIRARAQSQP